MTITLTPSAATLTVGAENAVGLNGAAVVLRLPDGCAYDRLLPGTLLERSGTPLAIAGPQPDGAILVASVLPSGNGPVDGDGTLFALRVHGATCASAPTLLRATVYDADGVAEQLPTELPSSGADGVSSLAVIAGLIAWRVMRR